MFDHERELFDAAITLPLDQRKQFVIDRASGDEALANRVLDLLDAHERIDSSSKPNDHIGKLIASDTPTQLTPGEDLGRYKILEKIGEGGFGEVYAAEQREPVIRRVALKILKAGMDTKAVLARFKAERQALALMDHANIARVLDAGVTESGRPFFAMQLVKGEPITSYCDRHTLSARKRLALFIPICDAVQHAHHRGIIHRDIKPSNILVTITDGEAIAQVIDFGIAKAISGSLTDETLYTRAGHFMGTPAYMSPEQAESSLDVDTRTDVYSLGVVLYELLSGELPFDAVALREKSPSEIQRILREEDPPKPSARVSTSDERSSETARRFRTESRTLARQLRGELDWIVLKAMEKDRTRRYETANALAQDIERHLRNQPVLAGPPGQRYRISKFVRRNRTAVTAGLLVVAALLTGVAFAVVGLGRAVKAERVALEEAHKAQSEREIAEAVNEFLNNDLLAAVAPSAESGRGRDVLMRDVLDEAAKRIDEASQPGGRFENKPLVEAAVRTTLGDTYRQLGEYNTADPHLTRALVLREAELGPEHPETLNLVSNLGNVRFRQGRYEEARELLQRSMEIRRRVLGENHIHTAWSIHDLGNIYLVTTEYEKAEVLYKEALKKKQELLGEDHWDTMLTMNNLGILYKDQHRLDEAEALSRQALELQRHARGPEHPETIMLMDNLADLLREKGSYAASESLYFETLEISKRVLGGEHPHTLLAFGGLAQVYIELQRLEEAESYARKNMEISRHTLGEEHPRTLNGFDLVARVLQEQSLYEEAETLYRQALQIRIANSGSEHRTSLRSSVHVATVLRLRGRIEQSEQLTLRAFASQRSTLGDTHDDTQASRYEMACLRAGQGRTDEALQYLRDAVEHGYRDTKGLWAGEPALRPLHGMPEFDALLVSVKKESQ